MSRMVGTVSRGIRTPIIRSGDDLVEIVTSCPTNWGLTPVESLEWLRENMIPYYPLGVYKDIDAGVKKGGASQ